MRKAGQIKKNLFPEDVFYSFSEALKEILIGII